MTKDVGQGDGMLRTQQRRVARHPQPSHVGVHDTEGTRGQPWSRQRPPAPRPGSTEQAAVKPTRHLQPRSCRPRRSLQDAWGRQAGGPGPGLGRRKSHTLTAPHPTPRHALRRSSEKPARPANEPPNSEQVTTGFSRVAAGLEGQALCLRVSFTSEAHPQESRMGR